MGDNLINLKNQAIAQISEVTTFEELEQIRIDLFGRSGKFTSISKEIAKISTENKRQFGITLNEVKNTLEVLITNKKNNLSNLARVWFDPTMPAKKTKLGHLHMVTKAIDEISSVFEKIGFSRVRYPEVEWDYFAFGALNFPENHPARDDWETFFVKSEINPKYGSQVLTPHTSNGQVREMERVKIPPVRMLNISRCYRRQIDVSHTPMFHQFEGLLIDEDVSISHLKGTFDYFTTNFFGPSRTTRLRPHHFRFTEPSFEVDVTCGVCQGLGCRLCKAGWLELGGAGMVHPKVLSAGEIDPTRYKGFAFGWGIERTIAMKTNIPDIRFFYQNDIRFLEQF